MPDADDFDVEYFRNLLKGSGPKEKSSPPAEPASPAAGKRKRSKPGAAAAREKGSPSATVRKTKKR